MNLKQSNSYSFIFFGGFKPLRSSAFLLFFFVSVISTNQVFSQDKSCWNNYRGNSQLTGITNASLPENPELLWSFKAPDGFKSSPVVCKSTIVLGSLDGSIYGLSTDGKLNWKINTENGIEAPALIIGDMAFVGNLSGDLNAIDINSGKILWTYKTENQIMGSPNYFSNGINKIIIVGSYDYCLHGIDMKTGKGLWKYEADNFINGTPSVYKDFALFGGCDGLLHLVNASNGTLKKRVAIATYVASSVAIDANKAYVGDYDGKISCIDINSMTSLWSYQNEAVKQPFIASPSVSEKMVYIGNRDKYVYCLDKETGVLKWKINSGGSVEASPVLAGNKLIVANTRGDLLILNTVDGKKLWSYELGSPVIGNPAVTENRIIVCTTDGKVYCFGRK